MNMHHITPTCMPGEINPNHSIKKWLMGPIDATAINRGNLILNVEHRKGMDKKTNSIYPKNGKLTFKDLLALVMVSTKQEHRDSKPLLTKKTLWKIVCQLVRQK